MGLKKVLIRLHSHCIIKRDPSRSALESAPVGSRTLNDPHFYNGEDALASILSGSGVVRAGSHADVEIADADLYKEWSICSFLCLRIDCLAVLVIDRVSWILVRTGFRIGKHLIGTELALGIRPGLTDTVIAVRCFCLYIILGEIPSLDDAAQISDIGAGSGITAVLNDLHRLLSNPCSP